MSKSKSFGVLFTFVVGILIGLSANAEGLSTYSIQPMQAVIKLEAQQTQSFSITNHSQEIVTVSVEALERKEKNGIERRLKTTDLVFDRTRLEIAPGQTATVNGRYKGRKDIDVERSFRVITKQLSDSNPKNGFRFSYETALFVSRDKMVPDVRVKLDPKPTVTGGLEVELDNRGTAHLALSDVAFFVSEEKSAVEKVLALDSSTKEKLGKLILLPKSKRKIKLGLAANEPSISSKSSIVVRLLNSHF